MTRLTLRDHQSAALRSTLASAIVMGVASIWRMWVRDGA